MGETSASAHSATLSAHFRVALGDTFPPCLWADRCYSSKDPICYPPYLQSRAQRGFVGDETTWEMEDL